MRKPFILFFIIFFCNIYIFSNTVELIDYYSLYTNYFPNDEGDVNEQKLINYIKVFLEERKIEYSTSRIDNEEVYSNSYNLEVNINGKIGQQGIVYIIPLNSYFYKNNYIDNSVSVYIGLKLIDYFYHNRIKKNIIIQFSGASSVIGEDRWGIKQYFTNKTGRLDSSIVNIVDIASINNSINLSGSMNRRPISSDILRKVIDARKIYDFINFDYKEIDRAKFLISEQDISSSYIPDNINLKYLRFNNIDKQLIENQKNFFINDYEKITDFFVNWTMDLDSVDVEYIDYNYQLLLFGNNVLLIPEYIILIIYLLIIFFIMIVRRALFIYKKVEFVNILQNVLYYFITLFFIIIFNIILYLFFKFLEIVTYGKFILNEGGVIYIISSIGFSYYLLQLTILNLPFNIRNSIYINTAIIGTYVNLILYSIININLGIIFLFTLIVLNLSHLLGRNFILKYVFYLVSFLPTIIFIAIINSNFSLSNFYSNIFVRLIIYSISFLPLITVIIRMNFINKIIYHINSSKLSYFIQLSVFLLIIILVSFVSFRYSNVSINDVTVIYRNIVYENRANLIFIAKNKIDNLEYFVNDKKIILRKIGRNLIGNTEVKEKPYNVNFYKKNGLFYFEIDSNEKIERINAIISVDKDVTFSQINRKYELVNVDSDHSIYKIFSQRNIGLNYQLFFDLPQNNNTITINYDIIYNNLPNHIKIEDYSKNFTFRSIYNDLFIGENYEKK